jgi:type III secretion protein L
MGLVFLIDRPGYRLAADRKVLKAREATVIEEITRAFVRAQGEINMALANLASVCAKATDEAYRTGMAQAEHDSAKRWTFAEVERSRLLMSLRPALADIVADAVTLIAKGIDRDAIIARALERFQSSLRDTSWARLLVHPTAVEAAETAFNDFKRETGLGTLARVEADASLPEDGCVLESELGRLDASLETQLNIIRSAIVDVLHTVNCTPPM